MKKYCVTMVSGELIYFKSSYDSVLEVADWLASKWYTEVFDTLDNMHVIFRKHIVTIREIRGGK